MLVHWCASPRSSRAPASSNVNPSHCELVATASPPSSAGPNPLQGPWQEGPLPAPPCSPGPGQGSAADRALSSGSRRSTTWQSCPRSQEREARPQRASQRTRPRAARRRRGAGLQARGAQPPDPGGLPTEKAWTGKQGRRGSARSPLGTQRPAGQCHALPRRPLGCVVRAGRCRLWPLLGCDCPRLRPETITWCRRVPPHTTEVPHLFPQSHLSENNSGKMS